MSSFGLIEENIELAHIHLAVSLNLKPHNRYCHTHHPWNAFSQSIFGFGKKKQVQIKRGLAKLILSAYFPNDNSPSVECIYNLSWFWHEKLGSN